MKSGRLSRKEWEYIDKHAGKLSAEEIAFALNREVEPVKKYLQKIGKADETKEMYEVRAEYDLKTRPYWKELKNQFNDQELELFLYHWSQTLAQFKMDVLPTEELQILDLIKLELLMNRALREQMECKLKIVDCEKELDKEKRKTIDMPPPDGQDREYIFSLERQIASLTAAKESLSKDFKELQSKKDSLYKSSKATRDQRFKDVDTNKKTFVSLMEGIIKDPQFREQCSLEMEKMKLAMQAEKQRLGGLHTFMDNEVDRCLLNADTVLDEE